MAAEIEATTKTTYVCEFERIGRDRGVGAREFEATDADDLADSIYRLARTKVASRGVEVVVHLPEGGEDGHGNIYCGMQSGGAFTIKVKAGLT